MRTILFPHVCLYGIGYTIWLLEEEWNGELPVYYPYGSSGFIIIYPMLFSNMSNIQYALKKPGWVLDLFTLDPLLVVLHNRLLQFIRSNILKLLLLDNIPTIYQENRYFPTHDPIMIQ